MPTPAFILELRKKIGHDLLLLPGVTGIVVNAHREVLLVKSSHGWWMPIGGCVEPGEQPADCIRREIFEETGVRATPVRVVSVDALREPMKYPNGDAVSFVTTTFLCRVDRGSPEPRVNDEESTEVRYFAIDALPELRPHHRKRIDLALADHEAAVFEMDDD